MPDYSKYYSDKTSDIDNHWFSFTQIQFDWILTALSQNYKYDDEFSVMDLGCGTGRLLLQITNLFPNAKLYGVDGTPEMVQASARLLQGRAVITQANLENYVPTQKYDVIISTTVLHHLKNPSAHLNIIANHINHHAFISEFAITTLPLYLANIWWGLTQASHKQAWTPKSFESMTQKNGLNTYAKAILKPDNFWRLQIYDLTR